MRLDQRQRIEKKSIQPKPEWQWKIMTVLFILWIGFWTWRYGVGIGILLSIENNLPQPPDIPKLNAWCDLLTRMIGISCSIYLLGFTSAKSMEVARQNAAEFWYDTVSLLSLAQKHYQFNPMRKKEMKKILRVRWQEGSELVRPCEVIETESHRQLGFSTQEAMSQADTFLCLTIPQINFGLPLLASSLQHLVFNAN